tara:strand:+ start:17759 stop:19477 length:1719 start_codon:yes stop_codon:yes gene_type:complete
MSSILNKLTEGMVSRDLRAEGAALLRKWEQTGLLEGIEKDWDKAVMARLLENQAKELLREASTMAAGDVEGFAAVAFPIVRRVFGGLIANDLVSVQPMSLPSGLIFFLDFQITSGRLSYGANDSIYGQGVVGQALTGGVDLGGTDLSTAEKGFYALNQGYTSPTGSVNGVDLTAVAVGTVGVDTTAANRDLNKICRWDPDLSGSNVAVASLDTSTLDQVNMKNLVAITLSGVTGSTTSQVRRLTQLSGSSAEIVLVALAAPAADATAAALAEQLLNGPTGSNWQVTYAMVDDFAGTPAAGANAALGAVVGQSDWGLENEEGIPELDIKVDSVSITAITKKLKAKWTPELGQDLNAYHNMDAEVELTSVLSEHIALEIDRELLEDLVKGAKAATYYWSRRPGKFVNKTDGSTTNGTLFPDFTGNVSEWYETLVETINDVSAQIHRKTLRGGATDLVCSPEVANILEFTSGFRANITADDSKGTVSAVNVGSVSKKWDVWVDPYFPRNVILVVRKGGSFLESGFVYAPYVPLQVTPTIFGTEDFVPRKGVMTRYAKKMVRPDFYGVVIVMDLLG